METLTLNQLFFILEGLESDHLDPPIFSIPHYLAAHILDRKLCASGTWERLGRQNEETTVSPALLAVVAGNVGTGDFPAAALVSLSLYSGYENTQSHLLISGS